MSEKESILPEQLAERFTLLSVLKHSEEAVTCLVADRESGEKTLLKIAYGPAEAEQLRNERRMDELIRRNREAAEAQRFPRLIGYGSEPAEWLARAWVEGHTVEALVETRTGKPGMARAQALDCAISVTETLAFLHGLKPPIIHRDIKPQNVVLDQEGNYHLIDMGISREFSEGAGLDTYVSGTRATAPPEQYGYRQTDERSDIFSVGVLLRYALTGDYTEQGNRQMPKDLRAITEKATRFDPDQRYQTAQELLRDLVQARFGSATNSRRRGRGLVIGLCALLAVSAALLAFTVPAALERGALRGLRERLAGSYTFREPLMEQAVRHELGKPEGAITLGDLEQVTDIHIYGKQIYDYEWTFWFRSRYDYCRDDGMRESGLYLENGGITSLEDVRFMPNLRELSVYNQEISDISALQGTTIHRLGIGHNPITSLEPLRGNEQIYSLNISTLDIPELTVLSTMSNLQTLNISGMPATNLAMLEDLPLQELNLFDIYIENIQDVGRLRSLETLDIGALHSGTLPELAKLPKLRDLTVSHPQDITLKDLETLPELERLYFFGEGKDFPEEGVISLPKLKSLTIPNSRLKDYRWLGGMPELEELSIIFNEYSSLDGLELAPKLERIYCGSEIAGEIREKYPEKEWELY